MMKRTLLAGCVSSLLLLNGCGDDSYVTDTSTDSTANSTGSYSGYLLDSAVANVDYQTETVSGVTDADGKYEYEEGETVTFTIGSITLGTVAATGTITPLILADASSTDDDTVINIARLLQTLDSDGDPSNGITISDSVKSAATTDVDFTQSVEDFAADTEVIDLIATAGESELVDEDEAISHLESTLDDEGIVNEESVSTWAMIDESEDGDLESIVVLSLLDDGTMLVGQVEGPVTDDCTDGDDEFGGCTGDGLEQCVGSKFAEYSIQELTEVFDFMNVYYNEGFDQQDKINDSSITMYDLIEGTTGFSDSFSEENGLEAKVCFSDIISSEDFQERFEDSSDPIWLDDDDDAAENAGTFSYYTDSNTMYVYASEVTGEDFGDLEQYTPQLDEQISTDESPLIGTWLHSSHTKLSSSNETMEDNLLAIIFTDSGYYVLIELEAVDEGENASIEVGEYAYAASAGTLTVTELSEMTSEDGIAYGFDYNGDLGLSDFYDQALSITVSNGVLSLTVPEEDGDEIVTFTKQ